MMEVLLGAPGAMARQAMDEKDCFSRVESVVVRRAFAF